jgi:hypothetical protein
VCSTATAHRWPRSVRGVPRRAPRDPPVPPRPHRRLR